MWRNWVKGAVTWRVSAQQKGAVTASANSSKASATGDNPSTSQCEESNGRNSISRSEPSGSTRSWGCHHDTRWPEVSGASSSACVGRSDAAR
ncbi:hypothetical protein D3C78_1605760 [compost metagenome]